MPINVLKISIFLLLGLLPPLTISAVSVDSLLIQGDYYFDYERYTEAIEVYEGAVAEGAAQDRLWYRLAFLYEQTEQPAQAIYFLRKIQYRYGGERIDAKIEQLMGLANPARFSSGERWSDTRQWLNRYQAWLLILGLAMAGLGWLALSLGKGRIGQQVLAATFLTLALVLTGVQAQYTWFKSYPQGVLIAPTSLYEAPSYAAPGRQFPIGLGATVQILDRQDIWALIQMGQFRAWVPQQVLREI